MLFYGRRRQGFPGLLIALFGVILVLSLAFASPDAARFLRDSVGVWSLILVAGLVVIAVLAVLRPRRRR
jgi:hypothetical protein